jgi:multicomponent Na+:H+ antiporter subunit C
MVDPLPQALMITTIVIGASTTALALMISIKIFHYYGTLEWDELLEREG